jgi:hypothetical protein
VLHMPLNIGYNGSAGQLADRCIHINQVRRETAVGKIKVFFFADLFDCNKLIHSNFHRRCPC